MKKSFIPFHDIRKYTSVIVVDSHFKDYYMLSHWRGASFHKELHDDTSTGICLNALKANVPELSYPYLTNNHFDVDGFLGIWSLMNPQLALKYENVLRLAALLGDFRELNWENPDADFALKLVCWINTKEKELFYPPFGYKVVGKNEAKVCVEKYEYFLPIFEEVIQSPDSFQKGWKEEYKRVIRDRNTLLGNDRSLQILGDIRLMVVETSRPLHYYALFGNSSMCDMVLSIYDEQCYELEYKYTTWVDTEFRNAFPRIRLDALAKRLNEYEENNLWTFDSIMDTGPLLRLGGDKLNKEERFDHPFNRKMFSSSIPVSILKKEVFQYYRKAYENILPQKKWTWKGMREAQLLADKSLNSVGEI